MDRRNLEEIPAPKPPGRPYPTLRGIFSVPKTTHRRDFLRENKLSLRALEKETTKKLAAKEPQRPKWMPTENTSRRSISQTRSVGGGSGSASVGTNSVVGSTNMRRRSDSGVRVGKAAPDGISLRSTKSKLSMKSKSLEETRSERCNSCGSNARSSMCDRAMQTEEIDDEEYLTKALMKCSSSVQMAMSNGHIRDHDARSIISHLSNKSRRRTNFDSASIRGDECEYEPDDFNALNTMAAQDDNLSNAAPGSARSDTSIKSRHSYRSVGGGDACDMDQRSMNNYMERMDLNGDDNNNHNKNNNYMHDAEKGSINGGKYEREEDAMSLGARSRQTICSEASQKSKRTLHRMGSRDNIRLPRYLEREKQERREQLLRQREEDPDCPIGHVLLSDKERLEALAGARKKFDSLVNELNRMPMTTQTLRVKNRKAEIDRELSTVENDIRIFSKPKVYLKRDDF